MFRPDLERPFASILNSVSIILRKTEQICRAIGWGEWMGERKAVGLFFVFAARLEEVTVGFEAVFAGNRVFENGGFLRHESKGHIGAKEDEGADGTEIRNKIKSARQINNSKESELGENDGDDKDRNIYRQNGFLGEAAIRIID